MNEDIQLAKGLGLFSIALGITELFAGPQIVRNLALPVPPAVVRAFGVREIASGCAVLAHPDNAPPDRPPHRGRRHGPGVLGAAFIPGRRTPTPALFAALAVLGVTALDLAAGVALKRRQARALATAERIRRTAARTRITRSSVA